MNKKLTAFYISILVLIGFTIFFIFKGNYEFLTYTVSIGILIALLMWSDKYFFYLSIAKWGFLIWLILHLLGGSVYFSETRLYDFVILNLIGEPFNILKYDQIVHIFTYVVFSIFVYSLAAYMSGGLEEKKTSLIFLITFLAAMGIGTINEIIEFITVAFFGSTGVGNYYNNALDLVFNAVGTLSGIFVLNLWKK